MEDLFTQEEKESLVEELYKWLKFREEIRDRLDDRLDDLTSKTDIDSVFSSLALLQISHILETWLPGGYVYDMMMVLKKEDRKNFISEALNIGGDVISERDLELGFDRLSVFCGNPGETLLKIVKGVITGSCAVDHGHVGNFHNAVLSVCKGESKETNRTCQWRGHGGPEI